MNELLFREFNGEECLIARRALLSTTRDIQAFQFSRYTAFIELIRERIDGSRARAVTNGVRTFHNLTSHHHRWGRQPFDKPPAPFGVTHDLGGLGGWRTLG